MGTAKQRLFIHDQPLIGIDIGRTGIKAMSIDTKKWSVLGYGYAAADLSPKPTKGKNVDQDVRTQEALTSLLRDNVVGKMPGKHVVLSIPTSRTYSRSISLPREAEKSLHEAIKLEAEQYIPVPITELNIGYEIVSKNDEAISVAISATPTTLVNSLVESCEAVGLTVLMAEPSINSVARLVSHTEEGHLPTILIDIGSATADIAILDGSIRAASSVNRGGNSFTEAIAKHLRVSDDEAHKIKVSNGLSKSPQQKQIAAALKPILEDIVSHIQKVIRYYSERIDSEKELAQVIIVGGGSNVPGLGDYFTNELFMPARIASPWQQLDFGKLPKPTQQFKPIFITAAGLACTKPKEVWK